MFGTFARVIAALVLVGLLGAVGVSIYQAGFAAGAATTGATVVAPYAGYGYGWGWGIGHGFFGFFGTLLVIFIIFGLLRAIFWRGPRWGGRGGWGYGHHGYGPGSPEGFKGSPWEQRARDVHDEWHRRESDREGSGSSGSSSSSSGPSTSGSSPS